MSKVHFGGVPTEIDVRKLREAFPVIEEGFEISHEQVEAVLQINRNTARYRTVTQAWRRSMLNDGKEMGAVAGIGFRCLDPSERIRGSVRDFQSGTRKVMRAVRRSDMVRTDDPLLTRKQELLRRTGAAIANERNSMLKEIEPPKPTAQLPRLVPKVGT